MKKILLSFLLLSAAQLVQASGFQVNTQGQKALGLGGAFAAKAYDASAVFFNPGAMAMYDSGMVSIGTTLLRPSTVFVSTNTGQEFEMQDQFFAPSYVYLKLPVAENIVAGLSVNSPFQVGTKWDDNWEGRAINREYNLNTYYIQPTISYKFTENFSIGAGPVFGISNFTFRRQIGEYNIDAQYKANATGWGYNIGMLGRIDEFLAFGVSFRSPVNFKYNDGEATFTNVPSSLSPRFSNANAFNSELKMPSTLSVGLTDRISDKLSMIFEFNLTGWSSYDSLNFDFENPTASDSRLGRRYENSMAFRAGAEYLFRDNLTLRAGAYYDETPIRDEFVFPELPSGNKVGLTAGLTYTITNKFTVDATYLFEWQEERNVRVEPGDEQIANVAGVYQTLKNGLGLGLNYNF
ncbi:MAG: outer membrane protein transport protein [Hymenobacteraceae bacterium]|nr:outer membrane protein transport protein [Hymenobacteraceae bacterium]MDX5397213.1 outer membrane protein transport protein [Hymenobacteraceae bacterium]MDX5442941.1 outer membrane protein transport protein [Hymenobacteraceae bacterium]MDX5513289.1 outer membrane protein transport protein [Hymenobacteraceae bacterium]